MAKGILRIKVVGDANAFEKSLHGVRGALGSFGKFAGAALLGVGAAAAGVGIASVKAFANFDAAMTQSTAIMGDLSDGMRNDMAQAARDVAKTTTFSATQAAEAYYFLASAGLDAKTSIGALPQVAKFAQAGMFDMALATDLLTDAQSALGLKGKDSAESMKNMARVSDVLVRANVLANASVEQFSLALTNKAGPAMKSVGMDIEEGVAVLAAFADQGIKAEEAGTQFGIVLRDLQTKALDNKEAFAEFGVAVFDSQGEMRNMADIVGDLEGALDGMSDAEKKATLAAMGFTDKSMASLLALLGTSDAIRQYEQDLRSAAGTTDEVSQKQLETFNAKLTLLKNKFTDVGLSIGEALMPYLMKLADWIDEHMPEIERVAKQALDTIATAAIFIKDEVIPPLITKFGELKQWMTDHGPEIEKVWNDVKGAAKSLKEFVVEMVPIVIEQVTKMYNDVKGPLGEFKALFNNITGAVAAMLRPFGSGGEWSGLGAVIKAAWSLMWEPLSAMLKTFGAIAKAINTVISAIQKFNSTSVKTKAIPSSTSRPSVVSPHSRLTRQFGGPIPGSGPVPITAHGGEYVLTKGDTSLMKQLIAAVGSKGTGGGITIYIQAGPTAEATADRVASRLAAIGVA